MSIGKQYILLKQTEIRLRTEIRHILRNQLTLYQQAQDDVMSYATRALLSETFVDPDDDANNSILYLHLFELLQTNMWRHFFLSYLLPLEDINFSRLTFTYMQTCSGTDVIPHHDSHGHQTRF
jgi:hypothetical protein